MDDELTVMASLVRKLASQVEISAGRVSGCDTHDQVDLTNVEYALLCAITGRPM